MKKIAIIALVGVLCFMLCACGKTFSEKLFEGDGIYQEFDVISPEEREQFLKEAAEEGYTVGFDNEGRLTLKKDGKTLVLGESQETPEPVA